jgi:hypothetical protein
LLVADSTRHHSGYWKQYIIQTDNTKYIWAVKKIGAGGSSLVMKLISPSAFKKAKKNITPEPSSVALSRKSKKQKRDIPESTVIKELSTMEKAAAVQMLPEIEERGAEKEAPIKLLPAVAEKRQRDEEEEQEESKDLPAASSGNKETVESPFDVEVSSESSTDVKTTSIYVKKERKMLYVKGSVLSMAAVRKIPSEMLLMMLKKQKAYCQRSNVAVYLKKFRPSCHRIYLWPSSKREKRLGN